MAAIRSRPTLEVNRRLIEGTNLASSDPTFGCGLATRGRRRLNSEGRPQDSEQPIDAANRGVGRAPLFAVRRAGFREADPLNGLRAAMRPSLRFPGVQPPDLGRMSSEPWKHAPFGDCVHVICV
jgi:hypothetical protein